MKRPYGCSRSRALCCNGGPVGRLPLQYSQRIPRRSKQVEHSDKLLSLALGVLLVLLATDVIHIPALFFI